MHFFSQWICMTKWPKNSDFVFINFHFFLWFVRLFGHVKVFFLSPIECFIHMMTQRNKRSLSMLPLSKLHFSQHYWDLEMKQQKQPGRKKSMEIVCAGLFSSPTNKKDLIKFTARLKLLWQRPVAKIFQWIDFDLHWIHYMIMLCELAKYFSHRYSMKKKQKQIRTNQIQTTPMYMD